MNIITVLRNDYFFYRNVRPSRRYITDMTSYNRRKNNNNNNIIFTTETNKNIKVSQRKFDNLIKFKFKFLLSAERNTDEVSNITFLNRNIYNYLTIRFNFYYP